MLDTMDFDFVAATLDKYGLSDRLDAKQVLLKMGGRRPGKHCVGKAGGKGSYISAEKQCAGHKGADGKLTAVGKQSARELAARVRDRKGMQDKRGVTLARMSLEKFMEPIKGAATEKQLAPGFRKMHKEERSELNKRRINGGRAAIVDKKAPRSPKDSSDRNAPSAVAKDMKETKAKAKEFEGFKKHYLAQAKDTANNTERGGDAYATYKPIDGVKFYFVKGAIDKHNVLAVKDGEGAVLGRYDVQIFEGEARRLGKAFSIADYRMNKDADRAALNAGIMDQDLPDAVRNHFPEAVKTYDFYKARRKDSSDLAIQQTSRVRRLNR